MDLATVWDRGATQQSQMRQEGDIHRNTPMARRSKNSQFELYRVRVHSVKVVTSKLHDEER